MREILSPDGTVLTKDCPVGWQAIKGRVSQVTAAFASLIFAVSSGIGLNAFFNQSSKNSSMMGEIKIDHNYQPIDKIYPEPEPIMGDVAIENFPTRGRVSNIQIVKQEIKKNRKRSRTIRK